MWVQKRDELTCVERVEMVEIGELRFEKLMREWIQRDFQLGRKKKTTASIFGKIKKNKKTRSKTAQVVTERNWVIMRCWCQLRTLHLDAFSNVSITEMSGHYKYLCSRILAIRTELSERSHFIRIFTKICIIRFRKAAERFGWKLIQNDYREYSLFSAECTSVDLLWRSQLSSDLFFRIRVLHPSPNFSSAAPYGSSPILHIVAIICVSVVAGIFLITGIIFCIFWLIKSRQRRLQRHHCKESARRQSFHRANSMAVKSTAPHSSSFSGSTMHGQNTLLASQMLGGTLASTAPGKRPDDSAHPGMVLADSVDRLDRAQVDELRSNRHTVTGSRSTLISKPPSGSVASLDAADLIGAQKDIQQRQAPRAMYNPTEIPTEPHGAPATRNRPTMTRPQPYKSRPHPSNQPTHNSSSQERPSYSSNYDDDGFSSSSVKPPGSIVFQGAPKRGGYFSLSGHGSTTDSEFDDFDDTDSTVTKRGYLEGDSSLSGSKPPQYSRYEPQRPTPRHRSTYSSETDVWFENKGWRWLVCLLFASASLFLKLTNQVSWLWSSGVSCESQCDTFLKKEALTVLICLLWRSNDFYTVFYFVRFFICSLPLWHISVWTFQTVFLWTELAILLTPCMHSSFLSLSYISSEYFYGCGLELISLTNCWLLTVLSIALNVCSIPFTYY